MKQNRMPDKPLSSCSNRRFECLHRAYRGWQILLIIVLMSGTDVSALMIPMATTTLVDRASCIVEGRVTNTMSRWTDDHTAIITEVTVSVTDLLLGDTNQVTFQFEGGIVDGLEQRVSDMPAVTNGQHILVFLRPLTLQETARDHTVIVRPPRYNLLGASQGFCHITAGRAVKDGFSVVGDATVIDRNEDVRVLKTRIRDRIAVTHRKGGAR